MLEAFPGSALNSLLTGTDWEVEVKERVVGSQNWLDLHLVLQVVQ